MRFAAILISCFVAISSLLVLRAEVTTTSLLRQLREAPVSIGPQKLLPRVWTFRAAHELTIECLNAFAPDIQELMPRRLAQNAFDACLGLASDSAHARPSDGRPWLLKAALAGYSGDIDAQLDFLTQAGERAPFESWQAERRLVSLLSLPLDALSADQRQKAHELVISAAEIAQTTQSGAELLAAYFVRRAHLRPMLSESFARALPSDQTRLINLIRIGGDV